MSAPLAPKLLRESTFQALAAANGNMASTLLNIKAALDTHNLHLEEWAGSLSALTTGDKSSLVGAINYVFAEIESHKAESALHDIYAFLDSISTPENGAAIHNSLYRGINFGSDFTAEQQARINDGTFKGLWTGDHWTKSISFNYKNCQNSDAVTPVTATHKARIGDCNSLLRTGDTDLTRNHLRVICDAPFFNARMNATNITTGGFISCEMWTKYLDGALNAFKAFFGSDHILKHRQLYTNAVTNGRASSWAWYDSYVDLLNEATVYGGFHWATGGDGTNLGYRGAIDKSQMALFRYNPAPISTRFAWWLRDVVSAVYFACVNNSGTSHSNYGSAVLGVRPAALIY